MFGFGEEGLTVESNRIPWLILTQLLVLLLLLFALLFFFVIFPLDPDDNLVNADTPPSSTSSNVFLFDHIQQIELPVAIHGSSPSHSTTTLQQHRKLQSFYVFLRLVMVVSALENGYDHPVPGGKENVVIEGEIATGPSMRREEEIMEEEDSSLYFHPCHYFQVATVAFLKCFGLDSSSETPSTRTRRKRKES
ncbi:unnamed protein product [Sphenostylis stenocarpa]|uniref:Uncharacterized protein n=1 Tax=Sphenostylis stenocarpa TaxID=92480 RepID=A0AA86SX96_9FABA|nr:unnamed protein product [Sphenostylis stenocarpa]